MPRLWSLAIALVVFVVYLIECPPVSGDKDSAEFTLVLALNGVAHPTGYPLFTLLGHFWVLLVHALGTTWAYAANSWTALGGAVAMYFLHRLGAELPPAVQPLDRRARFLLGLLPVALFAFNPIWTYETTLAEVYGWHVAWVLGTSLVFVRLVRALAVERGWTTRRLYGRAAAWGFLCGVGGAHHVTAVFVAAPLSLALALFLALRKKLTFGLAVTVLAAACLPLLSYAIIYWRGFHPALVQWPVLTPGLEGLIFHMTGQQYAGNVGHFSPSPEQRNFLAWYVYPFLFPGLFLSVIAALRARGGPERVVLWGLFASALIGTAYAFDYGVDDPSSYFLHPQVLTLVALAPVLGALILAGPRARRAGLGAAALAGIAALVLWVPWLKTNQGRVGLFVHFDALVHSMWRSIPMDSAIVFWNNDAYYKLFEYELLDHEKPGIVVLNKAGLLTPGVRIGLMRREGFDPMAGIVVPPQLARAPRRERTARVNEMASTAMDHVIAVSRVPVILFDPSVPTVGLIRKPPPDSAQAGAPPPGSAPVNVR